MIADDAALDALREAARGGLAATLDAAREAGIACFEFSSGPCLRLPSGALVDVAEIIACGAR